MLVREITKMDTSTGFYSSLQKQENENENENENELENQFELEVELGLEGSEQINEKS